MVAILLVIILTMTGCVVEEDEIVITNGNSTIVLDATTVYDENEENSITVVEEITSIEETTEELTTTEKQTITERQTTTEKQTTTEEQTTAEVTTTKEQTTTESDTCGGNLVWISETGSKYHTVNDCGRMNPNKAYQMTEEQAEKQGYEPCKKCH